MASHDLVLRGGRVIDGSGAAGLSADVAIDGERIAAVGRLPRGSGRRELDAEGFVVAPGFIDVHTHDDRALFVTSDMSAKVSQGVTTVVTGNCGISLAPLTLGRAPPPPLDLIGDERDYGFARFADYLDALDAHPPALNAACLVGHSSLRVGCMGGLDRPADEREIEAMRARLAEALDAGAVGLSTGLWYAPANAAPKSEIVALAELLRPAGAVYTTHMRDEAEHVLDSLEESFAVGREADVPVMISHQKVIGKTNFGRTRGDNSAAQGGHCGAADRSRRLSLCRLLHRAARVHGAARAQSTGDLVEEPPRDGRSLSLRNRRRVEGERGRRLRPPAAGRRRVLDHGRGRRPARARIRAHDGGLGRAAARPPSASAAVGHVPARARTLLPRGRAVSAGGSRPAHDRPSRRALRPDQPRPHQARRLCRSVRVRPGPGDRPRHLRAAGNACRRHRPCARERDPRLAGRRPYRRASGPRAPPPGHAARRRPLPRSIVIDPAKSEETAGHPAVDEQRRSLAEFQKTQEAV